MKFEVAIIGGGPAGLAAAIHAARAGLSTVVFEKSPPPKDKACGEGVMPAGVAELEQLGVLAHLAPDTSAKLAGVRYVQEDGTGAEARFPAGHGLGVRRTVLVDALAELASRAGATVRLGQEATLLSLTAERALVRHANDQIDAELIVAADGAASPIRRVAGLDEAVTGPRRHGLRRHFGIAPWSPCVEVHWNATAEAFVTPVGPDAVSVALLWEDGRLATPAEFDVLLETFPALAERLGGAPRLTEPCGAAPTLRRANHGVRDRLALIGDAAGNVDALTGVGLSLALRCAALLGEVLPGAVAARGAAHSLTPYVRRCASVFAPYRAVTTNLLGIARRPLVRAALVRQLAQRPTLFEKLLGWSG